MFFPQLIKQNIIQTVAIEPDLLWLFFQASLVNFTSRISAIFTMNMAKREEGYTFAFTNLEYHL